ncbi:MAG: 4-diphosphocytidyl-2-C-methyl-D-erythritol kinase [Pseudomonadales bacterium]|nr:4-diphosphocytidyl-2-C-methyl-D-erythritol kinase [Pseudomonadales bacterium]
MKHALRLRAPAKLNLFLHVTGRRADGYHTLQTVFQLLDFCDELEFLASAGPEIDLAGGVPGVAAADNLVVRAARALATHCAVRHGARIRLHKRIPHGGGLGGGSSDAATTLLALNRLWKCGLSLEELAGIGVGLGADVPVFVHGRNAWAEGIGEQLAPVALPPSWYLVIRPGCAVNTAAIFADRELTRDTPLTTIAAFLTGGHRNDCEAVVRKKYPEVDRALAWLGTFGDARMSGTGSCVFAAFADAPAAREVAARVPVGWDRFVARGIDRSPTHEALFD